MTALAAEPELGTPRPWGAVPRDVMTDHRLGLGARALYAYLSTFADRRGRVGAVSVRSMAEGLGVSPGTAQHHLGPLVELGHLLVEHHGDSRTPSTYWLGWGRPQARDRLTSQRATGRARSFISHCT